jgi:hypothetical protein
MAEQVAARRGGGFQRFVLWLVIVGLLAAVWWLASERNEHRYRIISQGNVLVIERGRFFPLGTGPLPASDKVYAPIAIPAGEKPPPETEFQDQNALDRWLFDQLSGWAKSAGQKGDDRAAATLVERAAALPGLSGTQMADLTSLRADLAWDEAQTDIANAAQLLDTARRKLEAVRQGNGAHAADASGLSSKLEGIQRTLHDLGKHP